MEFSNLGSHCGEKSCRRLDFLPLKCDACSSLYCSDHLPYDSHSCPERHLKDVQVPVCPLCNIPVPVPRGSPPDASVWAHMDSSACGGASAKPKKHPGACSVRRCKNTEPIPFKCSSCQQTVCISHRHSQDHSCGSPKQKSSNAQSPQTKDQIEQDHLLALALSQGDQGGSNPPPPSRSNPPSQKQPCRVS